MISAAEAKKKLIEGNQNYLKAKAGLGDVSGDLRRKTAEEGQQPYAIVISCSDSRVIYHIEDGTVEFLPEMMS